MFCSMMWLLSIIFGSRGMPAVRQRHKTLTGSDGERQTARQMGAQRLSLQFMHCRSSTHLWCCCNLSFSVRTVRTKQGRSWTQMQTDTLDGKLKQLRHRSIVQQQVKPLVSWHSFYVRGWFCCVMVLVSSSRCSTCPVPSAHCLWLPLKLTNLHSKVDFYLLYWNVKQFDIKWQAVSWVSSSSSHLGGVGPAISPIFLLNCIRQMPPGATLLLHRHEWLLWPSGAVCLRVCALQVPPLLTLSNL